MWAKTDPQNFVIRRDLVSVSPVCELGYRSSPESRIRLPSGPQQVVAKWAPESRSSGLLTSILETVPLCFLPPFLLPVSIRTQPSRAKPSLGSASNSYFSHLPVPTEGSKGQLLKRCSLHLFTWSWNFHLIASFTSSKTFSSPHSHCTVPPLHTPTHTKVRPSLTPPHFLSPKQPSGPPPHQPLFWELFTWS